jgi:hypothetical protein
MLDVFFVHSGHNRRVMVATKAACQIVTACRKAPANQSGSCREWTETNAIKGDGANGWDRPQGISSSFASRSERRLPVARIGATC